MDGTKASERSFSGANWLWPLSPITGAKRPYLSAQTIGLVLFRSTPCAEQAEQMEQKSSTFSSDNRQFVLFRSMECVEQAEQVEQENLPECAQGHISHRDNHPNSFPLFHLFHSPCGTEQTCQIISLFRMFWRICNYFAVLWKNYTIFVVLLRRQTYWKRFAYSARVNLDNS